MPSTLVKINTKPLKKNYGLVAICKTERHTADFGLRMMVLDQNFYNTTQ